MPDAPDEWQCRCTFWPVYDSMGDRWLACEHPERPYEVGLTGFHCHDCHACRVVAEALVQQRRQVGEWVIAMMQDHTCWLDLPASVASVEYPLSARWRA